MWYNGIEIIPRRNKYILENQIRHWHELDITSAAASGGVDRYLMGIALGMSDRPPAAAILWRLE
ncbi:MAG: hypothetical protein NZ922_01195 [Candidatus Methanomethyliaceae archaeon]|nr:hypothetical protein [Candidatus Methanomethyliaceae archaeon]MDW7971491.1 hypothetical protein [Nitrososphaerota archaeon]